MHTTEAPRLNAPVVGSYYGEPFAGTLVSRRHVTTNWNEVEHHVRLSHDLGGGDSGLLARRAGSVLLVHAAADGTPSSDAYGSASDHVRPA